MVRKPTLKVGLKYLGYYSPFLATDVTVPPLLAEQPKEEGEVGSQSAAPGEGIELLFIVYYYDYSDCYGSRLGPIVRS